MFAEYRDSLGLRWPKPTETKAQCPSSRCYPQDIDLIRKEQYPMLQDTTYLDYAGTTPFAKALIERFSTDMMSNLFGNPHSASPSSQLSTQRIEDVRLRVLRLFNADPAEFDVVFVANATAGIKLVMEGFQAHPKGFWFGYHKDSHTSLVGVRETATCGQRCFTSDSEVERWIAQMAEDGQGANDGLELFAYPGQSNMNGRRLPLDWCRRLRESAAVGHRSAFSLLDAAALVSTSPLDLSNSAKAPDFTVVSFYKIFGFPDLGALILRKEAGQVLQQRRYFGGGTVDMVVSLQEQWHARKDRHLHEQLEDGTLPIHSILALDAALDTHESIFCSLEKISSHTARLARRLYDELSALRHGNGEPVCAIYKDSTSTYGDPQSQGPIIAFNIRNSLGAWISNTELEKLAAIKSIQLRTGGVCNPGGIASALQLAPWEMKRNFSAGQRCAAENDIMGGKPTGVARVSFGAMSTQADVEKFLSFIREYFVESKVFLDQTFSSSSIPRTSEGHFTVESLTIYPIKSCAGWKVPPKTPWDIRGEGLAWDREWCLVHQGTGAALSQKRYPRMALIRPSIDFTKGVLRVRLYDAKAAEPESSQEIAVPLSADPKYFGIGTGSNGQATQVCGDMVTAHMSNLPEVSEFFTKAIGIPCTLARFPSDAPGPSMRYSKAHLQPYQVASLPEQVPGSFPHSESRQSIVKRPILFSNESPLLIISRSSLNRLNEQIKERGGKAAQAEVFRANIVVSEEPSAYGNESPYVEDSWRFLQIGTQLFQILGSCRRCQMVCIDQKTAEKNEEPFSTLAKTRRFDGKIFFGQHSCHLPSAIKSQSAQHPTVMVGDRVNNLEDYQELPKGVIVNL
ncbi:PLP-dependent transferase [Xylona heveae TC161]|uniref:Molybdenum cofactor sulfurase n=1 Tax=Xylona heveae (strain CBS 132557 / TC161) TaxID=1328760 RepID=A0A161TQW8_XYLHT|nr:PLP-dependent transferase [Xylona heveae TC161]KZF24786.1 PLP-dependent transferase [Xylona heveae TC161]